MEHNELDALLIATSKGDNLAFAQFYEKTIKGVYVFAYSYLKEKTQAEDISQETYLQVKLKAHTYRAGSNARAWLLQIVKNLCIDEIRKKSRIEKNVADEKEYQNASYSPFDEGSAVEYMLNVLTEEEKQIVIMHVFWGYKHKEIAKELSKPLGTVLWRYNGAIKKLKSYKEEV